MRPHLAFCSALALASLSPFTALGDVLSVGPNGAYAAPCAAFAAASDGDSVEIDSSGGYAGDVCGISKNGLHIRGMGGVAKIDAAGMNAQGKAIWVVQGDDTLIENIEFSGASVPDMNGAGIRQEGKNLTVRGCVFRDNENGILAGDSADSEIIIESSEFDHNGAGDGYSHNLYVNHVKKLTFRYNWSHRAVIGHLLKSRAAENHVLYNRITGEDGTSSYELNFPNGGKTYVIGNLIEQGTDSDNATLVSYLEEGENAANPSHLLFVVNNTFVNARTNGTFLNLAAAAAPAVISNNVFVGGGMVTNQATALLSHNQEDAAACLVDVAGFDYRLVAGTPCVDAGVEPGEGDGFSLLPVEHYAHPLGHVGRTAVATVDLGAYELGGETPNEGGTASGGSSSAGHSGATSGGAPGSGGKAPIAGSDASVAGSGPSGGSANPSGSSDDGGCGCRLAQAQSGGASLLLTLGAAVWLANRRRRHLQ